MSLFRNIDKSTAAPIFHKIASCRLLGVSPLPEATYRRSYYVQGAPRRRTPSQFDPRASVLDSWFINALIAASWCREHTSRKPLCQITNAILKRPRHPVPRSQLNHACVERRHQHTSSSGKASENLSNRDELLALVDQYDSNSLTDHLPVLELPSLQQPGPDPNLLISDEAKDSDWPPPRYKWPAQGEARKAIEKLEKALEDINVDPEESFQLYRALPAPRVPYLDSKARHRLLRNLAALERKDEEAMLRYLTVVDDMKVTGIPLTTSEWNSATSFAGRYVARTTEVEVEAGLRLWREMEHVAGVRANSVTFNILFDMATKAGKFKLAEMIYEEMANRGHRFNRFHHVSLIYYYGLKADGEGVRKAYKELVSAGEIVDTVVLNCVISSLLRAYEPQAAEQVYERMKRLHMDRSGAQLPPRDYRKRREVTKALMKMAEHAKRDPSKLKSFQNQSIIAPDLQTYRILVQYFAINAGELYKAVQLLDEMRWFNVPLHGSIFLALLNGFAIHGGIRYSHWTEERLESVWRAYLLGIDNQVEDLYIGKWMIIWALRAFAKCSSKSRTVEIWEGIKDKWNPRDDELDVITSLLRSLIEA